jgi:hypothetical protein
MTPMSLYLNLAPFRTWLLSWINCCKGSDLVSGFLSFSDSKRGIYNISDFLSAKDTTAFILFRMAIKTFYSEGRWAYMVPESSNSRPAFWFHLFVYVWGVCVSGGGVRMCARARVCVRIRVQWFWPFFSKPIRSCIFRMEAGFLDKQN